MVNTNRYCRNPKKLSSNLKNSTKFLASLRYTLLKGTDLYKRRECGYMIEFPKIVGHHLNLNLSYVEPNQNFNGSLGWYNGTHLSGPITMLADNQVDYIINEISNDYIIKTKFVLGNRDCLIHPLDRVDPFDCIPNKFNFQNNENFLIKINKTSSSHLINYKFIFRGFLFKVIYFLVYHNYTSRLSYAKYLHLHQTKCA